MRNPFKAVTECFVTLFLKASHASNNEGMKIPREENVSYKVSVLYLNSKIKFSNNLMVVTFVLFFFSFKGQASEKQRGGEKVSREGQREGQGNDGQGDQAEDGEREVGGESEAALKRTRFPQEYISGSCG